MSSKYESRYDNQFRKIDFYEKHPCMFPFIGKNYDKYRILQVGESHYINQYCDSIKYDAKYFSEHWWDSSFDNVLDELKCKDWVDTRHVVGENFCNGVKSSSSYGIFRNPLTEFENIKNYGRKDSNYNYFAFMNFFQMPALISGLKLWTSLQKSKKGWEKGDIKLWNKVCNESIKVFDAVVGIINPSVVIFTSKSAYNAYTNDENCSHDAGRYKNDERLYVVCHPGCPWWNRANGKYGREKFKNILLRKEQEK